MSIDQLEMKICQQRATIALLKAELHETKDAEKHLRELEGLLTQQIQITHNESSLGCTEASY